MKANETRLERLIEGTNQYLVPHYQRSYTWDKKEWDTLWEDLCALVSTTDDSLASPRERHHFMGSIVTMPGHSVPEGISKYLLIDGQQRFTTLLLILIAIRNRARELGDEKLAGQINDLYLTNRYQDGNDQYKLFPTQGEDPVHNDRDAFIALVSGGPPSRDSRVWLAYSYFARHVKTLESEYLYGLTRAIMGRLLLVSIVLEKDDNPYAIFESLNAKGQPLSQADLIRNFFFMCIHADRHDLVFRQRWQPMERKIGQENMTEFLRHFITRDGALVKQGEVYYTLKHRIDQEGHDRAEKFLDALVEFSGDYATFIHPALEQEPAIREGLQRIDRLQATVCYPFLLNLFELRRRSLVATQDVIEVLRMIENFLVRRYICGVIRAELNKLFPGLFGLANRYSSLVQGIREILSSRNYPTDREFTERLTTNVLYGQGDRRDRTKFILERIEQAQNERERIDLDDLTIEHVMPQKLSPWWRDHLGDSAEEVHSIFLHTLGNLTLSGNNPELSNLEFPRKREIFRASKLTINRHFEQVTSWRQQEIEDRARCLGQQALAVWPDLRPGGARSLLEVRGTTPVQVTIIGEAHQVATWQDVLRVTLSRIADLGEDVFADVARSFPRHVNRDPTGMRNPKPLPGDLHYEAHLNAEQIHRLCQQVAQTAGLTSEEWRVDVQ